jgi:SSS family solute:Na+ symporter
MVGGAGALACMIPAADLLLSTSMLCTRGIYCKTVGQSATSEQVSFLARAAVLVITCIALCLAIFLPNMLVNLLLTGYSGVTQFFPMIVLGLFWEKATKLGAYTGLIVGEVLVFTLILGKMDPFPIAGMNLNAGFVALVVNLVCFVVVSLLTHSSVKVQSEKISTQS